MPAIQMTPDQKAASMILMTGMVSGQLATSDQIAAAHDAIYGPTGYEAESVAAVNASEPPIDPPWAPPVLLPSSLVQVSYDPNIYMSNLYLEELDYDGYASETINRPNTNANTTASKLFARWRWNFLNTAPPWPALPAPPAYRIGMSFAQYQQWWISNNGNGTPPFTMQIARRTSSFDFGAAIAAGKKGIVTQVSQQPALGTLENQAPPQRPVVIIADTGSSTGSISTGGTMPSITANQMPDATA